MRMREAGVPEDTQFLTKPEIGRRMLERALLAGVKAGWVLADEVYGGDFKLRSCLEERRQRYVLGVASNRYVWVGFHQLRVSELIRGLPQDAWQRLSCGEGSKGPRYYDWAATTINCPVEGWQRWALCRRSIADPEELAYYLVFVPQGTSRRPVVRAAGRRWTIEEAIGQAKGEVGLDQYEVRSWKGWYRHITLSMLAHAYLAVTRAEAEPKGVKGGQCVRELRAAWRSSRGGEDLRADTVERGGDQEAALEAGVDGQAVRGIRARLVRVAQAPPGNSQQVPLQAPTRTP